MADPVQTSSRNALQAQAGLWALVALPVTGFALAGFLAGHLLDSGPQSQPLAWLGLAMAVTLPNLIITLRLVPLLQRLNGLLNVAESQGQAGSDATVVEMGAPAAEPKRILLVGDNQTSLHLLREVLMTEGHRVATADSGQAALELLQGDGEWDVVLADSNLPDMTGAMLLQTYRFGTSRPAPVYFLAEHASPATRADLDRSGAAGVLTKPVRPDELRRAVASAASGTTPAARDATTPALRAVPIVYVDPDVIERLAAISSRPEFLAEMIERAMADIGRNARELTEALSSGELERVRDAAHALQGIARGIGAVRLAKLAASLMQSNAAELSARRQHLSEQIRETAARSVSALEDLRSSPRAGTGTRG